MRRMALLATTLTIMVLVLAPLATADVPHMINYQGRLTDSGGNPVDTVVEMTFSICIDSAGFVCIWAETHDSIAVVNGLFNVKLGADSALTDEVFAGNNLWMHIKVGSTGGQVIEPPTQLITVPYAYRVSTVDGATGGIISGDVDIQSDLTVSGKATIGPGHTNTGDYAFVAGSSNSVTGQYATVGGGANNASGGIGATVSGGLNNQAIGLGSTVGGGDNNNANSGTIGGGSDNTANGHGTIGGGNNNYTGDAYATVGGGKADSANEWYSTVGGGYGNVPTAFSVPLVGEVRT
jgi:hypothetical protein